MRLYLVRHGKAERRSASGLDEDRPLRKRGERQARFLADYVAGSGAPPQYILTSRCERAIATARIIQEVVDCPLEVVEELVCGSEPDEAIELVSQYADADALMLVGHNMQMEDLAARLTAGAAEPVDRLRTGEAVVLDFDPFNGVAKTLVAVVRMEA
jgi:phosphohistidine phosphatase